MLRAGTRYPAIAALLLPPFGADELAVQVQRRAMQKGHSLVKVGAMIICAGLTVHQPCPQHILRAVRAIPDSICCRNPL